MKDKLLELEHILGEGLREFDFYKKRKYRFEYKIEKGIQHILFSPTKTRGKEEVYITIHVGFSYPDLNRIIAFIRNEQYRKELPTGSHNLYYLINPREPYEFYIDRNTVVTPIAEDIVFNIERYAIPFLDKCNTLEKYEQMLLEGDDVVRRSTVKRPEWNLLALSLLLERNNIDYLIEEYYDDFAKNLTLLQVAQEQIKKYDSSL